jgi:hypothetical protein
MLLIENQYFSKFLIRDLIIEVDAAFFFFVLSYLNSLVSAAFVHAAGKGVCY